MAQQEMTDYMHQLNTPLIDKCFSSVRYCPFTKNKTGEDSVDLSHISLQKCLTHLFPAYPPPTYEKRKLILLLKKQPHTLNEPS